MVTNTIQNDSSKISDVLWAELEAVEQAIYKIYAQKKLKENPEVCHIN